METTKWLGSTAIHTAHYHPDKYPPGAQKGDDAVKEMVRAVILHIPRGMDLRRDGLFDKHFWGEMVKWSNKAFVDEPSNSQRVT